jgi:DNA modification methylase
MSSSELDVLQAAFRAAGGKWSTFIIWAKNTFTLGRADYQRQYEPILYGWPEGASATGAATATRATSGTSRSRRRTICIRR